MLAICPRRLISTMRVPGVRLLMSGWGASPKYTSVGESVPRARCSVTVVPGSRRRLTLGGRTNGKVPSRRIQALIFVWDGPGLLTTMVVSSGETLTVVICASEAAVEVAIGGPKVATIAVW